MPGAEPVRRLVLYTREHCGLCDEFVAELAPWLASRGLALHVRDVDEDPVTRRRFGLKVPVLTVDGVPACHGHLDLAAVERLLDS
jgi:hypothetical protein